MPLLHETDGPSLPRLPAALLRALLPHAERDEVLADIRAEYRGDRARAGRGAATRWLWRQALRSAPMLLGWNWWRGWTGFEPRANAYRPGGLHAENLDHRRALRRAPPARATRLRAARGADARARHRRHRGRLRHRAAADLRSAAVSPTRSDVGTFWMPGWWTEEEFLYLRGKIPGFQRRRRAATRRRDDARRRRAGAAPSRPNDHGASCSTCSARSRCSAADFARRRRRAGRRAGRRSSATGSGRSSAASRRSSARASRSTACRARSSA